MSINTDSYLAETLSQIAYIQNPESDSLPKLPREIIGHIMNYVNDIKTLGRIAQTSRAFKNTFINGINKLIDKNILILSTYNRRFNSDGITSIKYRKAFEEIDRIVANSMPFIRDESLALLANSLEKAQRHHPTDLEIRSELNKRAGRN